MSRIKNNKWTIYRRTYRERQKSRGLCLYCPKSVLNSKYKVCIRCRKRHAILNQLRRNRIKNIQEK